jgi:hypothetical protein
MEVRVNDLLEVLRMPTKSLYDFLNGHPTAVAGKDYVLWFKGEGLPCLVAHIDHVYEEIDWEKRPILYNDEYIWSPKGTAGDDRCGVYAVMELYKRLEVNALFCDKEEVGGDGAREACKCSLLESVPYFIEIDRKGFKEAVFYNGEEDLVPKFAKVVSRYFEIQRGSFSDISILGDYFRVASVNLSAGFYNPHVEGAEFILIKPLQYTMEMVPKLIKELGRERYELLVDKRERGYYLKDFGLYNKMEYPLLCMGCGSLEWDAERGYWCRDLSGHPDPEQPSCERQWWLV